MLPGKDGFAYAGRVAWPASGTPIILLTAKGQEIDKVLGLELGADDYVPSRSVPGSSLRASTPFFGARPIRRLRPPCIASGI